MSMSLCVVDFESFYDQDFSLSKLTNEEYIRDPRFEVIGVGIKVNAGKTRWYSGTKEYLKQVFIRYEIEKHAVLNHHAHFDLAILNWHFDIRPKLILDTLSMARGVHGAHGGNSLAALAERHNLGAKGTEIINAKGKRRIDFTTPELARYGEYCCNDVDLTYALFKCLRPYYTKAELKIIDLTVRMFTEPVLVVDVPLLEQHLIDIRFKKAQLLAEAGVDKSILMSNPKFADLLRMYGIDPPMKISKTTGKDAFAFAKTDPGFKALLDHDNEQIQAFAAARVGNKSTLNETRTQRFIDIGRRGLIPVPLKYCGAHTTRFSASENLNFQNLPSRGGSNALKGAIMAPEGYLLCDVDSSQVECRVLGWFAGQDDLVEDFRNKKDVYKKMASRIYGVPQEEITKDQRFMGKGVILGAGYNMAGKRFKEQIGDQGVYIEESEADDIIDTYRKTYPKIPELWALAGEAIQAIYRGQTIRFPREAITVVHGGLKLPNGLHIHYRNLRRVINENGKREWVYDQGKKPTRIYGGKMVENICQALARCIITEQMLLIAKRYKVCLTVHDAVLSLIPEEEKDEAMDYIMQCMRHVPDWAEGLPLDCEAGYGKRYGDC